MSVCRTGHMTTPAQIKPTLIVVLLDVASRWPMSGAWCRRCRTTHRRGTVIFLGYVHRRSRGAHLPQKLKRLTYMMLSRSMCDARTTMHNGGGRATCSADWAHDRMEKPRDRLAESPGETSSCSPGCMSNMSNMFNPQHISLYVTYLVHSYFY